MSLTKIIEFMEENEIDLDRLDVRWNNQSGYGIYPRRIPLEKDEILLQIPSKCFVCPSFPSDGMNGLEQLIDYLLHHPSDPYVQFLRQISSIPPWRNHLDEHFPKFLNKTIEKHLNIFDQSRKKFLEYSDEEFQWAFYSIHTRSIYYPSSSSSSTDPNDHLCLIPYFGRTFSSPLTNFILLSLRFVESFE